MLYKVVEPVEAKMRLAVSKKIKCSIILYIL